MSLPSDKIPQDKACQILHDKQAQGQPLTDQQRKMFAARCKQGEDRYTKGTAARRKADREPTPTGTAASATGPQVEL